VDKFSKTLAIFTRQVRKQLAPSIASLASEFVVLLDKPEFYSVLLGELLSGYLHPWTEVCFCLFSRLPRRIGVH
jgi:hypothetical protein